MSSRRPWVVLLGILILVALFGCQSKKSPTPTLVPTLQPPTATASATPQPTATPTATATPSPTPTEIPLAARVNGEPILLADLEHRMDQVRAGLVAQGRDLSSPKAQAELGEWRQWMLNAMIEEELAEQAAQARGISVTDEEVDAIVQRDIEDKGREEFDAWLIRYGMTEADYWHQVRADLISQRLNAQVIDEVPSSTEHVHARHILVATHQEAEAILSELENGADFGTLARTYSLDVSTRDSGGDLDFFPRGLLLAPEVEEVAFSLEPGQTSPIVESMLGFHIVQVLEREVRPVEPQDRDALKDYLIQEWLDELWAQANVERYLTP